MAKFEVGQRVVISKPRSFGGGTAMWAGRKGCLESVSGRYCTLILDGQIDELGFFADELALDEVTC